MNAKAEGRFNELVQDAIFGIALDLFRRGFTDEDISERVADVNSCSEELAAMWRDRVPLGYRAFDLARLPDPAAHAEAVRCWKDCQANKGGVLLYGPSGSGKTFSAYDAIFQGSIGAVVNGDGPWNVSMFSAVFLARLLREKDSYGTDKDTATAFRLLRREATEKDEEAIFGDCVLHGVQTRYWESFYGLFIDDLHQARGSARWLEELYCIVEALMQKETPLMITCQLSGDDLINRLANGKKELRDQAEAIVRRLQDYCRVIEFDPHAKAQPDNEN